MSCPPEAPPCTSRDPRPGPESDSCLSSTRVGHTCTSPAHAVPLGKETTSREAPKSSRTRGAGFTVRDCSSTGCSRTGPHEPPLQGQRSISTCWCPMGSWTRVPQGLVVLTDLPVRNASQSPVLPTFPGAEAGPPSAGSPEGAPTLRAQQWALLAPQPRPAPTLLRGLWALTSDGALCPAVTRLTH